MEVVYDGNPYPYINITGLSAPHNGYYKREVTSDSDGPLYRNVQSQKIVMKYKQNSWMIGTEAMLSQDICYYYVNAVDVIYPENLIKGTYYWFKCGSEDYNNDVSVIGVTVENFNLQSGIGADTEIAEAQDADTKTAEAQDADTKITEAQDADTKITEVLVTDDVSGVLDSAQIYIPDLSELTDILNEDNADLKERYMSDDEPGVLSTIKEAKKEDLKIMLDDLKKSLNLFDLKSFSHMLFLILDRNHDGNISYGEYLSYLSTDTRGLKEIRDKFIGLVKNSLSISDDNMKLITDVSGTSYQALKVEDAGKSLNNLMNVLNRSASIHSDSREINVNDLHKYISNIYSFDIKIIKDAILSLIICIDLAIAKLQIEVQLKLNQEDEDLKANMLVLIQFKNLLQECDEVSEEELNNYVNKILNLFNKYNVLNINGNVTDIELNDKISILEKYMNLIKNFIETICLIDNKINSKEDLIYKLMGLKISLIQYDMMPKWLYPNLIQTGHVKRCIKYSRHSQQRSRSSSPQPIERSRANTPSFKDKTKGIDIINNLKNLLLVEDFLSSYKTLDKTLDKTDEDYIKKLFSDPHKIFWILTQPFELFQIEGDTLSKKIIEFINDKIEPSVTSQKLDPDVVKKLKQLKNEIETEKTIIRYYLENEFIKKSKEQTNNYDEIAHRIKYVLWATQQNKLDLNSFQLNLYNSLNANKDVKTFIDKTSSKRQRLATEKDREEIEGQGQGDGQGDGQGQGQGDGQGDGQGQGQGDGQGQGQGDGQGQGQGDGDAIIGEGSAHPGHEEDARKGQGKMDLTEGGKKLNNDELFEKAYTKVINDKNKMIYKKPNDKKEYVRYNKEYITIKEYEKVIKKKSKKGEILTFKF
jgi:hypothetical protein